MGAFSNVIRVGRMKTKKPEGDGKNNKNKKQSFLNILWRTTAILRFYGKAPTNCLNLRSKTVPSKKPKKPLSILQLPIHVLSTTFWQNGLSSFLLLRVLIEKL